MEANDKRRREIDLEGSIHIEEKIDSQLEEAKEELYELLPNEFNISDAIRVKGNKFKGLWKKSNKGADNKKAIKTFVGWMIQDGRLEQIEGEEIDAWGSPVPEGEAGCGRVRLMLTAFCCLGLGSGYTKSARIGIV